MLNKIFFGLKIIDIEVKLDTRNFIKISRVEIIKPGQNSYFESLNEPSGLQSGLAKLSFIIEENQRRS